MKRSLLFMFLFILFFSGSNSTKILGYKPVYVSEAEAKIVSFEAARELKNQGKIYIKDNYIFVGDIGLGVHVFDNSNPASPQKIGFLKIYGNHDIAIKGNSLYADNYEDLITVDISNIQAPAVTNRIADIYPVVNSMFPPNVPYQTYFECVDLSRGYVVDWVQADLDDPKCYTNNNYFYE